MTHQEGREFRWPEGLAICVSMIGVQLCSEVINQWGLYFYSPSGGVGRTLYVPAALVGIIFIIGTLWDAVSSPVVGILSDKTPTRPGKWRVLPIPGRRLPYIFWGAFGMIFTLVGFWYPPVEGPSLLNLAYGTVFLCAHWTLFSLAVVPLNALGPEIARSESARVAVGTWVAVGMILGLAFANALPGVLITALDPGRVESGLALRFAGPAADVRGAVGRLLPPGETGLEADGAEGLTVIKEDGGGGASVSVAGPLYERIREHTQEEAVAAAFPEALREKMTPVRRKAWSGARFDAPGPDAAQMDAIRARLAPAVAAAFAAESQAGVEKGVFSITYPTSQAELMDEKALAAALADAPGVQGPVGVEKSAAHLRLTLPPGAEPSGELADFLAGAAAREAVRANLILMDDSGAPTVAFTRALRGDLAFARVLSLLSGAPGDPSATRREESFSPAGYRRVAMIFAIVSFLTFLCPVLLVRERHDSEAVPSDPLPCGRALLDALRNKPFLIYAASFFLFTIGFLAVQRALPYWAELGLDGDEGTITKLLMPFILVAVGSYAVIPLVARRVHMKWMMFAALAIIATGMPFMYLIGKSGADFATRQLMGMLLFGYCGVGQAIIYVMIVPMMGDIIDYDERLSGERREALYNGLSAFIWKASMAGSVLLASLSMSVWGNRVGEHTGVLLVGPFAGLFGLLGMVVIALYPVMKLGAAKKDCTP